jgi:photosystem II stability/assembly factor-like uncharacterized protein
MRRGLAILVGVLTAVLVTSGGSLWGAKSGGSLVEVEQARLVSPRLGLVVASARGVAGVIPRQRLLVGTSAADGFLVVGPRLARDTNIDDVFFLDRRYGWIATWSVGNVSVHVYRTSDGGRHWRKTFVTTHTMGAGAIATLQFLTPRRGWLVNQQPTAPDASLYTTTDGGQHWHL